MSVLGRNLGAMSAEPVHDEDPADPEIILRDLPEQERAQFLSQYHEAVDAARTISLDTGGCGGFCIHGG